MMKPKARWLRRAMCGTLGVACVAGAATVALAQSAGRPLWEVLDLSSRLYEEGMERRDAILVLAAARLRLSELPIEPNTAEGGWVSGRAMLGEAEDLAASDPDLRNAIARLKDEIERGGLEGPQVASVRVEGQTELRLSHGFKGGRPAYVYAEGAPTSRLSIIILENRTRLCETSIEVGRALCRWVAARDGPVTTVVRNHAANPATILVVTN